MAQAISQAVVDSDEANLRNARAQVAVQKAILDKKTLRAPFDGKLGLRQVAPALGHAHAGLALAAHFQGLVQLHGQRAGAAARVCSWF